MNLTLETFIVLCQALIFFKILHFCNSLHFWHFSPYDIFSRKNYYYASLWINYKIFEFIDIVISIFIRTSPFIFSLFISLIILSLSKLEIDIEHHFPFSCFSSTLSVYAFILFPSIHVWWLLNLWYLQLPGSWHVKFLLTSIQPFC